MNLLMMVRRLLLSVILFTAGCTRSYQASFFISDDWAPGHEPRDGALLCKVGADIYAALLRSDKFWDSYIARHFADPAEVARVRRGLSVSCSEGKIIGRFQTKEITLQLNYGGEMAFETIHRALFDFSAPILEVKKSTPTQRRTARMAVSPAEAGAAASFTASQLTGLP